MARELVEKWRLEGDLVLDSDLSTWGGADDWVSDQPVARSGDGTVYIPASSLAGAVRSYFEYSGAAFAHNSVHNRIWGNIRGRSSKSSQEGDYTSFLLFDDCLLKPGNGETVLRLRDGVWIDRVEGRASSNIKYDRETVLSGNRFGFSLVAEIPADPAFADAVRDTFFMIAEALKSGRIALGAASSRGMGQVHAEELHWRKLPLNDTAAFLDAFENGEWLLASGLEGRLKRLSRPGRLEIKLNWRPLGSVMVKESGETLVFGAYPFSSPVSGRVVPTLPGSSVKGALRAAAERIMATLAEEGEYGKDDREGFRAYIARHDLVVALFGRDREPEEAEAMMEKKACLREIGPELS
ncbi:RAMP superfamily CRISPR-associated protein [Martelella lutilitoris]|nr:RAMP superfamily CRISPR-associated protein [Martelella lutilitoris]